MVSGFGAGFSGNNFSAALEYDQFSGDIDPAVIDAAIPGATYNRWHLKTTSLMGRYYFTDAKVRPYLAAVSARAT